MKFPDRSFTLIEVLMGASILILFLGSLFNLYTDVSKTSVNISKYSHSQQLALRILKQFALDARNTIKIISSSGDRIEILVNDTNCKSEKVEWTFNLEKQTVIRKKGVTKEEFSSTNKVRNFKVIVNDDSVPGTKNKKHNENSIFNSGCLIFDVAIVVMKSKGCNGYFRRVYSRIANKKSRF